MSDLRPNAPPNTQWYVGWGTTSFCWTFLTLAPSTIHLTSPSQRFETTIFLKLLKGGAADAASHATEDGAIEDPHLAIGVPPAPDGGGFEADDVLDQPELIDLDIGSVVRFPAEVKTFSLRLYGRTVIFDSGRHQSGIQRGYKACGRVKEAGCSHAGCYKYRFLHHFGYDHLKVAA